MSKPHVWVVETAGRKLWHIVGSPARTMEYAKDQQREWQQANPDDQFRVAKYVRVEPRPVETKKPSK